MHPIARCTIPVRMCPLPCRSVPVWTQSGYSAVPPRSEATRCTAVSPRWKASRRFNVGPVRTQARRPTISFLFEYPSLPRRRIAHRPLLTSCPLFEHSPVPPRCATPFGCTHCLAMPLLLTGSTRCPAIQKSPCCGVPVRIISAVLPCRMTQRQLHCPPVWVRHRFPRCTARFGCALLHRYAADARKYACYPTISSVQKQSRCPLSILGRRAPPPPRCAAPARRHSGAAAPLCPTYFPSQTTRTGRFSFSVRSVFLWKLIGTALSFLRMDNDSQAAG